MVMILLVCGMSYVATIGHTQDPTYNCVDTQGNVMHCTAKGSIAHNFLWLKEVQKAFLKSDGFNRYPFELVEIDELEPTNNKYLIDVGYVTNVGRITQTRTGSKTLDFYMANCRVTLTKEILPVDNTTPKVVTLENLLMWAQNRKYDVTIDKVRTKKGWNYPSCGGDKCKKGKLDRKDRRFWCDSCNSSVDYPVIRYKLELEISDETAEEVVVMIDETTRVLLNCSASSILECEGRVYFYAPFHFRSTFTDLRLQDEEASLGLPIALANIVGTTHTLELKSHTYYEHMNYESFTCWKVVTGEDVEEGVSSAIAAANDASKASELKRLNKALAVATPSKPSEENKRRREELEVLTQRHLLLQTANQKKEMWPVLLTREKERGSAFFACSDILYNQSLGKYEFRLSNNIHEEGKRGGFRERVVG
ncbi:ATP-dependent DNA helicase PIF1-like protein [Tanacetum coccineum]|uniref:ATP-dependent DNA helicase PIF1-like protein n=1 Tax=Tanacetum coccineum TaxID=301880 RepID=A0ABQ5CF85_9ASTR